ncbi:LysM peptidoglycan-binding domain-containing protein [Oleiharenicola lentus]|uniref:LysM peptidoglycan-binding domain-containing protein n=1 Tax=Oleiharenicola lentus TaxID=2508720 RepID=UPI003F67C71C
MDTLSRDSNSSGSILPLVGVIAGGLALILSIAALVQLTKVNAKLTAQGDEIAKIATLETEVRAASTKSDTAIASLRSGIQTALDSIGASLTSTGERLTKIEEAQKARAAAPAAKGGASGGAAAAPTGVVDAAGNYTVASGDSLTKIARKFGVRADAIEAKNPGLDPTKLKVGQKIKIR